MQSRSVGATFGCQQRSDPSPSTGVLSDWPNDPPRISMTMTSAEQEGDPTGFIAQPAAQTQLHGHGGLTRPLTRATFEVCKVLTKY